MPSALCREFMGEAVPLKAMVMSIAVRNISMVLRWPLRFRRKYFAGPGIRFPEMEEFPREEITE